MDNFSLPTEWVGQDLIIAFNELIQVAPNQPPDFMQMPVTLKSDEQCAIRCEIRAPDGSILDVVFPKSRLRWVGKKGNIKAPSPGELGKLKLT